MFPIDSLPAHYTEEREAAEAARRLAHIQEQQAKAQATSVSAALKASQSTITASASVSASAALQRPPPLTRPTSSTVLGSIFQSLRQSPPASTKGSAELEAAMLAERRRDADFVSSSPGWW